MKKKLFKLGPAIPWIVGLLLIFVAGQFSSIVVANRGVDYSLHDTYFVVAPWHLLGPFCLAWVLLILFYGFAEAILGAAPRPWLARSHLVLSLSGLSLILAPQIALSLHGTEGTFDPSEAFTLWSWASSAGYATGAAGIVVFVVLLADAFRRGRARPSHD